MFDVPPSDADADEAAAMPSQDPGSPLSSPRSELLHVLSRHEKQLMAIEGVRGVAIGRGRKGDDVLVVYVTDASVSDRVPSALEGHPVEIVLTGEIDAYG
jgi:hypothetical protein